MFISKQRSLITLTFVVMMGFVGMSLCDDADYNRVSPIEEHPNSMADFDDVPLANVPSTSEEYVDEDAAAAPADAPATNFNSGPVEPQPAVRVPSSQTPVDNTGKGKLRGDLTNLVRSLHASAGRAYEDAKPALSVVHGDLMESVENLRKNPKVQMVEGFAKPKIEYAKQKVTPFYEQGRGKIYNFLNRGNRQAASNNIFHERV